MAVPIIILAIGLSFFIGIVFGFWLESMMTREIAVEFGYGEYNKKTGKFEWKHERK